MSKPNSSSFWNSNKTNKVCSQLLHHMLLMVFPLSKANLFFEQNTPSQRHITKGTFLTICQFLAIASFEVWIRSWILPDSNGHIASGRPWQKGNLDYFPCELLELDLSSDSLCPQASSPRASRFERSKEVA